MKNPHDEKRIQWKPGYMCFVWIKMFTNQLLSVEEAMNNSSMELIFHYDKCKIDNHSTDISRRVDIQYQCKEPCRWNDTHEYSSPWGKKWNWKFKTKFSQSAFTGVFYGVIINILRHNFKHNSFQIMTVLRVFLDERFFSWRFFCIHRINSVYCLELDIRMDSEFQGWNKKRYKKNLRKWLNSHKMKENQSRLKNYSWQATHFFFVAKRPPFHTESSQQYKINANIYHPMWWEAIKPKASPNKLETFRWRT